MVRKSQNKHQGWCIKPNVNQGKTTNLNWLAGFLNHQQYVPCKMHGIPFSESPEIIARAMELPHAPCGKMHLQSGAYPAFRCPRYWKKYRLTPCFHFKGCFGDKSNFTGKLRMATLAQKRMKTSFSMMQKMRKTTSRREFRYLAR